MAEVQNQNIVQQVVGRVRGMMVHAAGLNGLLDQNWARTYARWQLEQMLAPYLATGVIADYEVIQFAKFSIVYDREGALVRWLGNDGSEFSRHYKVMLGLLPACARHQLRRMPTKLWITRLDGQVELFEFDLYVEA